MIVQEDNTPPHAHANNRKLYDLAQFQRLLWPADGPDLNSIEPAWWWMKRRTKSPEAPRTKKALEHAWVQAWKELPQSKIQKWIERIPQHLKEIIRLDGGNEFKEGTQHQRSWKGKRLKGHLSTHCYLSPLWVDSDEEDTNLEPP